MTSVITPAGSEAIERKLRTPLFSNPVVDGGGFVRRLSTCRFASPGCLFHVRGSDGDEGALIISVVEIDDYDRVSPNKAVGRAPGRDSIGDRFSLREGRGSITILDITD